MWTQGLEEKPTVNGNLSVPKRVSREFLGDA